MLVLVIHNFHKDLMKNKQDMLPKRTTKDFSFNSSVNSLNWMELKLVQDFMPRLPACLIKIL